MPLRHSARELGMFAYRSWLSDPCITRTTEIIAMQCDDVVFISSRFVMVLSRHADALDEFSIKNEMFPICTLNLNCTL